MHRIHSFEKDSYIKDEPIIIYGASVYGEIAYWALKTIGIKPDYFCDRASKSVAYFDIKILKPEELVSYLHANIIIASVDYFNDILKYLHSIGCDNIYDMSRLIQVDINVEELTERARYKYDYGKQYIDIANAARCADKLAFARLQYVVTERCSLKCKDCSYLMQYYRKPQNIDLDKYKHAFVKLLQHVGTISDLRIIGGEPLMNPLMYKVIKWFHDDERIKTISVYTNGTIVPNSDNITYLKFSKVRVHVSQYEVNKERLKNVISCFDDNGIKYYVEPFTNWQTPGNLLKRNCSELENKTKFQRCYDSNGYSFYKDRLYRCPRSVHGISIGAMPDEVSEYVDFGDESIPDAELENRVRALMEMPFLAACDYCDGLDNHRQSIEPAIQTNHVMSFEE